MKMVKIVVLILDRITFRLDDKPTSVVHTIGKVGS